MHAKTTFKDRYTYVRTQVYTRFIPVVATFAYPSKVITSATSSQLVSITTHMSENDTQLRMAVR